MSSQDLFPNLRHPSNKNGAHALRCSRFLYSLLNLSMSRYPWVCKPFTGWFCYFVTSGRVSKGNASRQVLLIEIKHFCASPSNPMSTVCIYSPSVPRGLVSLSLW